MNFMPLAIPDVRLVELDPIGDRRGWFAEAFRKEKSPGGPIDQVNFSFSRKKGTLRGLHYQEDPAGQAKTVFCTQGSVLDLAVDIRPKSPTFLKSLKILLTPQNERGLHIPAGFAHGWYSLEDNSQIIYLVNGLWSPTHERGIRFDDPEINLILPDVVSVISPRDAEWPLISRVPV